MAKRSLTNVVLYLRMSSEDQEQSVPSQRAELTSYAKKQGYNIIGEYVDEAISGDDTHKRLGFLQMRDDAQSGKFDVVLCWDQDRFGWFDILDAGFWITPFRQAGVRLETIAQGKIDWEDLVGQLIYSVNQMGKAQFLRDLSRNTVRGMLASAKEGRSGTGGPSPYGYGSKDGEVWVIPDQAKVVRWIFDRYLELGGTLRGIARELNQRNVPPPRSKVWRSSSVAAILRRRKYTGTFVYGNRNGGKYFCWRDGEIVPRRKTDKCVESEPIVHENKFEAIVSQEVFDRAQVKLQANKGKTTPRKARTYLLSGLVRCGDCGGAMGGVFERKTRYRCLLYHSTGTTSCHCNRISEAPLVSVITRKIQEEYLSEPALNRLRRALVEEQERTRPRPQDRRRLKAEIEKLDRKIDQGAERVLEAPAEIVPTLYRKLEEFKAGRDQLHRELQSLSAAQAKRNGNDGAEVDRAIETLKNLGEALSKARPEDSKELLASIVSKIELHFEPGSGRQKRAFSHGTVYLRPDAGGAMGSSPSEVTSLSKLGSFIGIPIQLRRVRIAYCRNDIRPAKRYVEST